MVLQRLEIGPDFRGMLVAQLAIFLQAFADNALDFSRQGGVQVNGTDRIAIQNKIEDTFPSFSFKWQFASRHFIENNTEGEQVRAWVQALTTDLLRRHMRNGSQQAACRGQLLVHRPGGQRGQIYVRRILDRPDFRQTKIENLSVLACGDEQVSRFDIAM